MELEPHEPHNTREAETFSAQEPRRRAGRRRGSNSNGGSPSPFAPDPREGVPAEPSVRDRLQYLQALHPYGAHDDLMNVILSTPDTRSAAKAAYEVLNPDVYGLPYLKEQHELRTSSKVPPSDRVNAFSGIAELLEERAADVLRRGQFESLSQMREYNHTVRTFAVDTSDWDAQYLSTVTPFTAFTQQHLPLTSEELARLSSCRLGRGARSPTAAGGMDDGSGSDTPRVGNQRRVPLPPAVRKYLVATTTTTAEGDRTGEEDGEYPVEEEATPKRSATASGPSTTISRASLSGGGAVLSGFESYINDSGGSGGGGPVAPVVRWAPKALRVGPAEAQQQQEDMLNIFDSATFFDIPLLSGSVNSTAHHTTTTTRQISELLSKSVSENRAKSCSPQPPRAHSRSGSAEGKDKPSKHHPHAPDATSSRNNNSSASGEDDAMTDIIVDAGEDLRHSAKKPHPLRKECLRTHTATATATANGDGSGSLGPEDGGDLGTGSSTTAASSLAAEVASRKAVAAPDSDRETTPKTATRRILAERRRRRDPPVRLQERVKSRTPLEYVFQQSSDTAGTRFPRRGNMITAAAGARSGRRSGSGGGTLGTLPSSSTTEALDNTRGPHSLRNEPLPVTAPTVQKQRESHTPYGGDGNDEDGASVANARSYHGPNFQDDLDDLEVTESTHAEDPFIFLNTEEERWENVERRLRDYEDVFDSRGRCYIVKQISESCPLFAERMGEVMRSLLLVVSKELTGHQLAEGLCETPIDLPLFRNKLLSTSTVTVRALEFNLGKCDASIDPKDPSFVKAKVKVTRLELEPIHFAYMDEAEAAKQNKAACEARKRMDRRKSNINRHDTTYKKGYTCGTLRVKVKNVSVSLLGTAALLISGAMVTQVDKASVSIGTLDLSTDVKKLSFLFTVGKPIVKAVLTNAIESAIVGQHRK